MYTDLSGTNYENVGANESKWQVAQPQPLDFKVQCIHPPQEGSSYVSNGHFICLKNLTPEQG